MKKKGFTLIELLAVIVILAIIALIATPTILGVIEKARKGSAEQSALGYIDAVEKQIAINELDVDKDNIVAGTYSVSKLKELGVSIKGESPSDDSWVQIEDNQVKTYSLKFNRYTVSLDNNSNKKIEKNDKKDTNYIVSISVTNVSSNLTKLEIEYNSTSDVIVTPENGYYLSEVSCTNGYTTNAVVGKESTKSQTVTISNNGYKGDSICTFKGAKELSPYTGDLTQNGWTATYTDGVMTKCKYSDYDACTDSTCNTIGLDGCVGSNSSNYYYNYRTILDDYDDEFCFLFLGVRKCYETFEECQEAEKPLKDENANFKSCEQYAEEAEAYSDYYSAKGGAMLSYYEK